MKLTAVILDWAGTIVDHGSCAPVAALRQIFASAGITISADEARRHMGVAKRTHVASILGLPEVRERWIEARGRPPQAQDIDDLYAAFIPKQLDVLEDHSGLIAGAQGAADRMRSRGLKVGSTTGYNRAMLQYILERAREQRFAPDCALCPDDVPSGRPAPFMCYLNALRMEVSPMWTLVKIGDTPVDIEEGLNAGMWTIGITRTGNEVGLTPSEWSSATESERARKLDHAQTMFTNAGAHFTAESVADCDEALDLIDERVHRGERP